MIKRSCLICLVCLSILVGCSAPQVSVVNSNNDNVRSKILVINSNADIATYQTAQTAFIETTDYEVEVLNLGRSSDPLELVQDVINASDFSGVYSIGGKALAAVNYIAPDQPVVYSSVLNWRKFENTSNFYGIGSKMSPEAQLTWFKFIFPELKRLAVVYGAANSALVEEAVIASDKIGIELLPVKVGAYEHVEEVIRGLSDSTRQLWLISDALVMPSMEAVNALFSLSKELKLSVLSYDEMFIQLGALLTVDSDRSTTGRQAALMMKNLISHQRQEQAIRYPAGSRIVLSQKQLEQSSLQLNQAALTSINDIR